MRVTAAARGSRAWAIGCHDSYKLYHVLTRNKLKEKQKNHLKSLEVEERFCFFVLSLCRKNCTALVGREASLLLACKLQDSERRWERVS